MKLNYTCDTIILDLQYDEVKTLDRVELGIKIEQIGRLKEKGEYLAAARVADSIEWRKVKKWSELNIAEEIYEKVERYEDARNICVYAYNRNLGGKRLVYKLTELSILIKDYDEADALYKEYTEDAPHDPSRFLLLYKLNKARNASTERLIEILEEYKENELDEQYEYELAALYAQAGRVDDCIRECDDLILWFNDGDYVEKALRLKKEHAPLTRAQQHKLDTMEEFRAAGMEYEAILPPHETEEHEEPAEAEPAQPTIPIPPAPVPEPEYHKSDDIVIPEKDYSIYDTQNIQAELAKSMELIMSGLKPDTSPEADQAFGRPQYVPEDAAETETLTTQESEETAAVEQEQAATSEPIAETPDNTIEYGMADIPMDEGDEPVDEPTREIRINTHHWNQIKSVMVPGEENTAAAPVPDGTLPSVLVTQVETEAVAGDEPEVVIADISGQLVDDIDVKVEIAHETEPEEEPVTVSHPEEAAETEPAVLETESVQSEPQTEQDSADAPVEGQIDIMSYLEAVQDKDDTDADALAEDTTQDSAVADTADDFDKIVSDTVAAGVLDSEELEAVDFAMDELTRKLMAEVAADMEAASSAAPAEAAVEDEAETDAEAEELQEDSDETAPAETEAEAEQTEEEAEAKTEDAKTETDTEANEPVEEPEAEADNYAEPEAAAEEPEPEQEITDEEPEEAPAKQDEDDYILKPSQRKYLKKYLFMQGMEESVAQLIKGKNSEVRDKTSSTGNIVIMGKNNTDKTTFAINLFKAMHADEGNRNLKIAKTTADILNRKGIYDSISKIRGTTLIIENAGQLTKAAVEELSAFMQSDTGSMLVIITGEDYAVKRMLTDNPELRAKFSYKLELKHYTVNELVEIAKEYARVKGYYIEDKALLKLYLMIGELGSSDEGSETDNVKEIVDAAIEKNGKKGKGLFGKRSSLIPLKEKNFV